MAGKNLTLANLHELDNGKAANAINHALRTAVADINDRPGDATARRVDICFAMAPKIDKDSLALDTVAVQVQIKTKLPVLQSAVYPMLPSDDGRLQFQERSPFDPRQGDLPYEQKPAEMAGDNEAQEPSEQE